jgi:hypothetical protein
MKFKEKKKAIAISAILLLMMICFQSITIAGIDKSSAQEFTISIIKPENAIYRNNQKILPFFMPIVLRGNLDVEIKISPPGVLLDRLEIYINEEIVTVISGPGPFDDYSYTLEGEPLSQIKIEVHGYTIDDSSGQKAEITIWRIFQ